LCHEFASTQTERGPLEPTYDFIDDSLPLPTLWYDDTLAATEDLENLQLPFLAVYE